MNIKAVLFDLDGTLLPMDQYTFVKAYFGYLSKKLYPYGFEPQKLVESIWNGTMLMVKNNGTKTNEEVFWDYFKKVYGDDVMKYHPIFEEYYHNEFQQVKNVCGFNELSKEIIEVLKQKGKRLILATNPIFPSIATYSRTSWAGLNPEDFEYITTYENSSYCKPNLDYYKEILKLHNLDPKDCLMVGNDVTEDMVTKELGMQVFLITDNLINKNNVDISIYPHGNLSDLLDFIKNI